MPHRMTAEIASSAWAEARTLCGHGPTRRQPAELTAAALQAHRAASAGLGRNIPVTGLGPGRGGVRNLATFLAVYAVQHIPPDARSRHATGTSSQESPADALKAA